MRMSYDDGYIQSTGASFGDPTSTSYPWGLSNAGDTNRIIIPRTISPSTSAGYTGEYCWDSSYIYICVTGDGTNTGSTWMRAALSSF